MKAGASGTTAVDVPALARELVAELVPLAEFNKIDSGFDEVIPLSICAAPELLRQILRNALENALNYAPAGGQVSIRLSADGGDDIIEVIDDGPGVPARTTRARRAGVPLSPAAGENGEVTVAPAQLPGCLIW